jgi:cytochrome b subunit of formate dehydrogenase
MNFKSQRHLEFSNHRAGTAAHMQWIWTVAVVLSAVAAARSAEPPPSVDEQNHRCMSCHGQSHIATDSPSARKSMVEVPPTPSSHPAPPEPQTRPELFLTEDALAAGVHAKLGCVDCHPKAEELPHPQKMPPPDCSSACHPKAASNYLQSAHASAAAKGDPKAPACWTCHGGHNILSKSQRQSRIYPLNVIKTCGDCHEKHFTPAVGKDGKQHIANYMESVHGQALTKSGLVVSATCADCHGSHMVLPSKDPRSLVYRGNIAGTCGVCHVGVTETYETSIHGQEAAKGNPKAPICTDCHRSHSIGRTDVPEFMGDIVLECGQCHDQPPPGSTRKTSLYETYRRSYHGQVNKLGSNRAARCSDCHGAHNIRKISDPQSQLSAGNRVDTCRRCHPQANAKFAQFDPHADYRDGQGFPLLHAVWLYFMIMMSFAFGFFGLHSLLWFVRSVVDRIRIGPRLKRFGTGGYAIKRFNRVDRINHAFVILSFFGLTLTGLPLLYSDQVWAQALAGILGGVRSAGLLHRFFAIMLIGNFVVHFFGVGRRVKKDGFFGLLFGPNTMLPRKRDVTDCLGMFRWFFKGGKKPAFDRWTYWEKFDYSAEVFGSGIIGLTGLLLWYPEFFSRMLPGWMFNVATVIHGYEALLAIGFIFSIHFFNAHLRMEKFPVDDVIFTGRLTEEEFKHERGAEYARLEASGELDKLRVPHPHKWWRIVAVCIGVLAMTIGISLVTLIILAGLKLI